MTRFAPGCCCCRVLFDHFQRPAPTAHLAPHWQGIRGAWQLTTHGSAVDGWVLETDGANALVLARRRARDGRLGLLARLGPSTAGSQARLVWNYVDDDTHHYAEVTAGTPYLRVVERVAGVEQEWVTIHDGGADQLIVFCSDGAGFGHVGRLPYCDALGSDTSAIGGSVFRFPYTSRSGRFGLATGGTMTGSVRFDYVSAHNFGEHGGCCACATYCLPCASGQVPRALQIVIAGAALISPGDGTYYLPFGSGSGACAWPILSCGWNYDLTPESSVCIRAFIDGGTLHVIFNTLVFQLELAESTDCTALENLAVPIVGWDPEEEAPTCTVTAIP